MTGESKVIDWRWRLFATVAATLTGGTIAGSMGATVAGVITWNAFYLFATQPRRRALISLPLSVVALTALLYAIMNGHYIAFGVLAFLTSALGFVMYKVMDAPA